MNGQQMPHMGMPPFGEPLTLATMQIPGPPSDPVLVFFRVDGPGKSFAGLLNGEDAVKWAEQFLQVAQMSKAGLFMEQKPNG